VLRAAVAVADREGIASLSMRRLADKLGVVPMALYKHVTNKEELLDGMIDIVIGEIDPPARDVHWKTAVRQRILSARQALLRHPWASGVLESRKQPTAAAIDYLNSTIGLFRAGGFSVSLAHHAAHTMGSRLFGFTQDLFLDTGDGDPEQRAQMLSQMAPRFPYLVEVATAASHDDDSVVGQGCDDQYEFEFAVDLLLDGFERLMQQQHELGNGGSVALS
jgi:AcrR family transcriptional regulator